MSLTDKRNLQMLIVFEFLLERQYAQGINALLPAKDICAKTTVGIGWGQVGATRGALAKAILHMRVPTSLSEDNETLRRAADLVIQELVALNGGAPSSSFSS
jgi:ribosomal protein S9